MGYESHDCRGQLGAAAAAPCRDSQASCCGYRRQALGCDPASDIPAGTAGGPPHTDEDIRQLGQELLQQLHAGRASLPPSLRTLVQHVLAQLQLLQVIFDSEPADRAKERTVGLPAGQPSAPQPTLVEAARQPAGAHVEAPNNGPNTGAVRSTPPSGARSGLRTGGQSAVVGRPGVGAAAPQGDGNLSVPGPGGDQQHQFQQNQTQTQIQTQSQQPQQQQQPQGRAGMPQLPGQAASNQQPQSPAPSPPESPPQTGTGQVPRQNTSPQDDLEPPPLRAVITAAAGSPSVAVPAESLRNIANNADDSFRSGHPKSLISSPQQQQVAQVHHGATGQQPQPPPQSQGQKQAPLIDAAAPPRPHETQQAADSGADASRSASRHIAIAPVTPALSKPQTHTTSDQLGALPGLEEALRVAWAEVESRSVEQQHSRRGDNGGAVVVEPHSGNIRGTTEPPRLPLRDSKVGSYDLTILGGALQQHPPSAMPLTAVLEVLQLMVELMLMPRYEWLRAAQQRLREEIAAAEVCVDVDASGEAAAAAVSRLADLQLVYEGTVELMQLCWEADGGRREEGREDAAAGGEGEGEGPFGSEPGRRAGVLERVTEAQQLSGGDGVVSNGVGTAQQHRDQLQEEGKEEEVERGEAKHSGCDDLPLAEHAANMEEELAPLPCQQVDQHDKKQEEEEAHTPTQAVSGHWRVGEEYEDDDEGELQQVPDEEEDAATAFHRLQEDLRAAIGPYAAAVISPATAVSGSLDVTAVQRVLRQLTQLVTEAAAAEAIGRGCSRPTVTPLRGGPQSAALGPVPLTAVQVAHLIGAASRIQPALSPLLLSATVRLFVALGARGSGNRGVGKDGAGHSEGASAAGSEGALNMEHVLTVVRACTAAGYQPPANLLEPLAQLAFAVGPSQPDPLQKAANAANAAAPQPSQHRPATPHLTPTESPEQRAAISVRALHACAEALVRLGCRLNAKQFASWVGAVLRCPRALSPSQMVQLMAACVERGFVVHATASTTAAASGSVGAPVGDHDGVSGGWGPGSGRCEEGERDKGAPALLAAAITPTRRLQRLSAAEAVTVAQFAAQQGLQLHVSSIRGSSRSAAVAGLLAHLSPPRLGQLTAGQLAALLPALYSTGALMPSPQPASRVSSGSDGGRTGSSSHSTGAINVPHSTVVEFDVDTDTWLAAHSAALLPYTDALQLDELLPLLRTYRSLSYCPPPLLLLGFALALEVQLGSSPLPALLQALRLLLVDLDMAPNSDLAAAIRDELVPRLVRAASAPPPPPVAVVIPGAATTAAVAASQQQHLAGPGSASILTLPRRLLALDVLSAVRVRPHPAQLAVLLEPELAGGEGRMCKDLTGDDLVRLLAHCTAFRALPSYRFLGEWLEACAAAMRPATTSSSGGTRGSGDGSSGGPVSSPRVLSPKALAQAGWCLAQMGVQPDRAWQEDYRAALAHVLGDLDAESLSLTAHSVLALRSRPEEGWLEALVKSAAGCMGGMDAGSATRLLHFVAAAELRVTKDWMQSFFLHTTPHLQPLGSRTVTADQIALLLRALAQLGFRPPVPWLAAALDRLRQEAATLTPACFPLVLSSLARLCPDVAAELGPGSVVEVLVRVVHATRQRFSAWELRWLLDTLGSYYPSYKLPGEAEANLITAVREAERLGREWGRGNDVAAGLGDVVSAEWLRWAQGVGAQSR